MTSSSPKKHPIIRWEDDLFSLLLSLRIAIVLLLASLHPAFASPLAETLTEAGIAIIETDPEEALNLFQQAIVASPSYSGGYAWIGRYYAMQGNLVAGRKYYRIALTLSPQTRQTLLWDGLAALELGDDDAVTETIGLLKDYCTDCEEYQMLRNNADAARP